MESHSDETRQSPDEPTAVDDWRGLGDLLSLATERLTTPVEGMHRAIADRWLGLAGSSADPVRRVYHAFTTPIYKSVRLTGAVLGKALGWGARAAATRTEVPRLWHSHVGSHVQSVTNALWGDELERRQSALRVELGLRNTEGLPVGLNPQALAEAFPESTTRLVVLLHGLGETESCWQRLPDVGGPAGLASLLEADGHTPLLVRYNTGRHVSDNGTTLAAFIEEVVGAWPVPVEEVSLVGHSMGGLVARSALHAGRSFGHSWTRVSRHIVTLASPHLGSPIEKGVNVVSWGLNIAPESRPLADLVDQRSDGIKDLRFGAITKDDWQDTDPDTVLDDNVGEAPALDGVEQHFVAGVITDETTHPVGVLLGDLVVRAGSATGRGRRRQIDPTDVHILGGLNHVDLLHDPAVHTQVRAWLAPDPA
ncbi:MAG: alpha/beta fold hydrolase [Actinomycetota bacterium]|nr:alpha/beta fold hydrolase [Actinomycetota bacterium]